MKKSINKLFGLTLSAILFFAPAPVFSQSDSFIGFTEGRGAVDEILGAPLAPCVSRMPTWELAFGEGAFSRFTAKNADADCREALGEALLSFTNEEKDMLTKYTILIDSLIDAELPILNSFPWNFAVIGDSSSFGVPAGKHIVLTKGMLNEMREWLEKRSSMFFVGMEMLVHEKVLILQSMRPAPFEKFYREVWGFRKIAPLTADRAMQDNGLFFARVPKNEWVTRAAPKGKEYIMPALLLRDAGRDAGGTVQRVAIAVDSTPKGFFPLKDKNSMFVYRDLRLVQHYRKQFSQSEYDYHPAELSANLLAKFLVMKYVSSQYATVPANRGQLAQIDVLMKYINEMKK